MKELAIATARSKATQNTKVCHDHLDQPLLFFCETCTTAICRDCTVVAHDKTAGHSIVEIKDAVAAQRHALEDQLLESHDARSHIQKSSERLESCVEKLLADKDSAINSLKSMMRLAHQQLELCEQQATDAILQHHGAEHYSLLDKQHCLYQTTTELDELISQSEELVTAGDVTDTISIIEKLKVATGIAKTDCVKLEIGDAHLTSDMITGSSTLHDKLCQYGKTCFKEFLPSKFVLKNDKTTAGVKSVFQMEFINDDDNKVPITTCFLAVKIIGPMNHALPVTLDTTSPECTITFTPQRGGRHEVVVMYMGYKLMSKQPHITVSSNNPPNAVAASKVDLSNRRLFASAFAAHMQAGKKWPKCDIG